MRVSDEIFEACQIARAEIEAASRRRYEEYCDGAEVPWGDCIPWGPYLDATGK